MALLRCPIESHKGVRALDQVFNEQHCEMTLSLLDHSTCMGLLPSYAAPFLCS